MDNRFDWTEGGLEPASSGHFKIKIGFDNALWGTVEFKDGEMHYAGDKPDSVRMVAQSIARSHPKLKGEELLQHILKTTRGRMWAAPAEEKE